MVGWLNLLKAMSRGLIVTDLMGHGVNITTGNYSRGASGFWVENGEIQYPVSGITIAGNLKSMNEKYLSQLVVMLITGVILRLVQH